MAPRGYCTTDDVAAELGGVVLDGPQLAAASARIAAAELWLDHYLARQWLVASPATEQAAVYGQRVYLTQRPVGALQSVTARTTHVGAVPEVLTVGDRVELLDAARGLVILPVRDGAWVAITYTHTNTTAPPADVALACAKLAAHWLGPVRDSGLAALAGQVRQLSVGQGDLSLTFADLSASAGVPPDVLGLLGGYQKVVFA